jgi:hypothetical protein
MPAPGKDAVGVGLVRRSPSAPQGRARHQTAVMESFTPALCGLPSRGSHARPRPSAKTAGVSFLRPAPRAYPALHRRAFGADDGQSLSSAVRKPHFLVTAHTRRPARQPRRLAPAPTVEAAIARELRARRPARARSRRHSLKAATGLLRRAPGGGCPAGRDAGAPAARTARRCFSGALAGTPLAVVDEVVGERRARERSCPRRGPAEARWLAWGPA